MKYLKQGLLLSAVIFISSTIVVHALSPAEPELRPFTLVEKSTWGSGPYNGLQLAKGAILANSPSGYDIFTHSDSHPLILQGQLETQSYNADWLISNADSDYVFKISGSANSNDIYISSYTANDLTDGDNNQTPLSTFTLFGTRNMIGASLVEGHIYFNAASEGLFIFDVQDPANIQQVGHDNIVDHNDGIVVIGNKLFTVPGWIESDHLTIQVYDITNKQQISKIDEIDIPVSSSWGYLTYSDSFIFLSRTDQIITIDLQNHEVKFSTPENTSARWIQTDGNYLYRGSQNYTELMEVYRIDNGELEFVNAVEITPWLASYAEITDNKLYLIAGEHGLYVYDLSNPEVPTEESFYNQSGQVKELALKGDKLFVAHGRGGLRTIGLTDDFSLDSSDLTHVLLETADTIAIEEHYAYTGYENGIMKSWDLTNPAAPILISEAQSIGMSIGANESLIDGDDLIIATNAGISLMDKSSSGLLQNIRNLQLQVVDNTNPAINDMLLYQNTLYLATSKGLQLVDLSDRQAPRLIGILTPEGETTLQTTPNSDIVFSITQVGQYIYTIGTGIYSDVIQWDVSAPTAPRSRGEYLQGMNIRSLANYADDYLVTMDMYGLITVLESNNLEIAPVATLQTLFTPLVPGLSVFDSLLVADSAEAGQVSTIEINQAPIINESRLDLDEDSFLTGQLTAENEANEQIYFQLYREDFGGGYVTIEEDGSYRITPEENAFGEYSFDVDAYDQHGAGSRKNIRIFVRPINDAPEVDDAYITIIQGRNKTGDVSAWDYDEEDVFYELTTPPSHGSLTVDAQGLFTYNANDNYIGQDTAEVTVSDGNGGISKASIFITIKANTAPSITPDSLSGQQDTQITGAISANDADDDSLVYTVSRPPVNGSVTLSQNGRFTYTPNIDYVGDDSFEVTVADPDGAQAKTDINLSITEKSSGGGGGGSFGLISVLVLALLGWRKQPAA